jgi:hypothetical protein
MYIGPKDVILFGPLANHAKIARHINFTWLSSDPAEASSET